MTQDQLQSIVTAVVESVVKTLVEQLTPIVVDQVKQELKETIDAGMAGVLSLDPESLAAPVAKLILTNDVIRDEIDEIIELSTEPFRHGTTEDIERVRNSLGRLTETVDTLELEHVSIHSDEFKAAVRAAMREVL